MILRGRVSVSGRVERDPGRWVSPGRQEITLDGQPVNPIQETTLVLFNKPRGVVSTLSDPEGRPCLRDALPHPLAEIRGLRPIGRLDRASAGLLLWSNDTDLAQQLLDPEFHVEKEYRVKVRPQLSDDELQAWRQGLNIGDRELTLPAGVEVERTSKKSAVLRVTLREGRNRQIRRMAQVGDHQVEWLVRVRLGPIELGDLGAGEARLATHEEQLALERIITPSKPTNE